VKRLARADVLERAPVPSLAMTIHGVNWYLAGLMGLSILEKAPQEAPHDPGTLPAVRGAFAEGGEPRWYEFRRGRRPRIPTTLSVALGRGGWGLDTIISIWQDAHMDTMAFTSSRDLVLRPANPGSQAVLLALLGLLTAGLAGCGESLAPVMPAPVERASGPASGVCPPFPLRDEQGAAIDPVKGVNDRVPYSPRQTCGTTGCHDYAKITEGFHFTQGKGEAPPREFAERYAWVTSPGNYGGNWCSPAPLYRQLAPKKNRSAREIDLTSYEFVTATCGNCHPGGGPLELDRDGKRYDQWMRDPASGFVAGGDNALDGDYHKARWSETGVLEADCLLCHLPEYDLKRRNAELAKLNFRWGATAGAGLGTVSGAVKDQTTPVVEYDRSRFDAAGNVIVHLAPQPRNETCLGCHAKPDWKKRGASFSARTDVHLAAGMRCVDCHAAGSRAADPRIRGREVHQFGKGDDPSGWVRNDLDNTVRGCKDCHLTGWRNAPRANHAWLPPLHLEKLSCQACHIPARAVKSALVQASDVYNPAPRITPPPKHIWTFYDQERGFWNHYGELDLFTNQDQPTDLSRPTLIRYKGQIFPGNRVHSAWVGFEEAGKQGLSQLFMRDFFQMWTQHRAEPQKNYPELATITDDDGDGALEVNRPQEIDALLAATRSHLIATGFPLEGRRLVWVSDSRAYYSSTESRELPREEHEATAYASVYKFSHDVAPAKGALGAGGCTDCHSSGSAFFQGAVLSEPFSGELAAPRWVPNHELMGLSPRWVRLGNLRTELVQPLLYLFLGILALLLAALALRWALERQEGSLGSLATWAPLMLVILGAAGGLVAGSRPELLAYMTVRRAVLDANHFWVACTVLGLALAACLLPGEERTRYPLASCSSRVTGWLSLLLASLSGGWMLLWGSSLTPLSRLSYTVFELALALAALSAVVLVTLRVASRTR
jgi:hypothetical protein